MLKWSVNNIPQCVVKESLNQTMSDRYSPQGLADLLSSLLIFSIWRAEKVVEEKRKTHPKWKKMRYVFTFCKIGNPKKVTIT